MFRGNYNAAFRVPAFNQLFNGQTESLFTGADIADPAKCPGGVPKTGVPGCESLARWIDIISGGNRDLEPETAKMFSLGTVFEPSRNFSASTDYFNINRKNTIQILSRRQLVDNFTVFPDCFIRDAAGNLTDIDLRWLNSGGSKTAGLEIALRGGHNIRAGRFVAGLDGTYLTKKQEQVVSGGAWENRRGVFSFSGDLGIKWKHNAFIGFTNDDWNLNFTQIFRNGYKNQQLPGVANGTVVPPDVVVRSTITSSTMRRYHEYLPSSSRSRRGSRTSSTRIHPSPSAMTAIPEGAARGSRASPTRAGGRSRSWPT